MTLPGLDLGRLAAYLERAAPSLVRGPLRGQLVGAGRSNLTYEITDGTSSWVVRRPPLGHVLATAHDMAREYRVITALGPTVVPVPRTHVLCTDATVLGAPFFVMDFVDGTVYRTADQTATLGPDNAAVLAAHLVDVLADLHGLRPADHGLADFGRPAGFLERQLRRWRQQLDASRSRELAGIDELHARLAARVPPLSGEVIVHGDYRLDNMIIEADGRIAAVLDWEMSTLGDPLADLGLFLVYWNTPTSQVSNAIGGNAGFPPGEDLAARYAGRRGVDLSNLPWYVGLGYFKLAVIVEGVHYRYLAGQTVGEGFDTIGELVPGFVAQGLDAIREA